MTRIYFKPQGCSLRNPRSRAGHKNTPHADERMMKEREDPDGVSNRKRGNWRKQLNPDAIEQIADGLEKMMLSWSTIHVDEPVDGAVHDQHIHINTNASSTSVDAATGTNFSSPHDQEPSGLLVSNSTADQRAPFLLGAPKHAMAPALEEMMRGELIKTCKHSLTNAESLALTGQQSAEASFWYLTPAKSLPNCVGQDQGKVQDASSLHAIEHILQEKTGPNPGHRKWPRIRSIDEDDSESDNDGIERTTCQPKHIPLPAEKVSYHIKTAGSSNWNETIEINGGNQITELLGKELTTNFSNANVNHAQLVENKNPTEFYKKKIEELQIALLECAMEYEVKIVEMKMQMLHLKSEQRQKDGSDMKSETDQSNISTASSHQERTDGQRVEYLRKQLCRLQREKLALSRDLNDLKKRERQFDLQRRSLDDALGRVNTLQKELGRREQEIVDCQLREKEVRAQLYEVQLALHKAQAAQIEPRKLLSLLPALREWLQTIKKVPHEPTLMEPCEKYCAPRTPPVDSIVCSVTREIQALQKALSKLASRK